MPRPEQQQPDSKDGIRDIAPLFNEPYSFTAPLVLGDMHAQLLHELETRVSEDEVLVVLGPGGRALPYTYAYEGASLGDSNRDWLRRAIGANGKLICVDYVMDKENGGLLVEEETFRDLGFFDDGYFLMGETSTEGIVWDSDLSLNSINFMLNNLREPLRMVAGLATKIDATLSIHHASLTRSELKRIYQELFRVLRPGGILHLGEGNVDMNHSEDKVLQLGGEIAEFLQQGIYINDEREAVSGHTKTYRIELGAKHENLPKLPATLENPHVVITGEGEVVWRTSQPNEAAAHLAELGYPTIEIREDEVVLLLIDPLIPEDVARHIQPVHAYYDAILARAARYNETRPDLFEKISAGIAHERDFALSGVVEYYMGEDTIVSTLEAVGFTDIQVIHHEDEPFYNIVARKPERN